MPSSLDSIVAIATAPGRGGVGVVRVSGKDVESIAVSILGKLPEPRHATYSAFLDSDGSTIDRGIALYFPRPNSYTGEDVLELQAHGGSAVLSLLLKRCLSESARLANPGEFTQRAFINNKLDLLQAETVADLINATSEQAVRSANRTLEGDFSKTINISVEKLISLRVIVEANFDFPEEELNLENVENYEFKLKEILNSIEQTFKSAQQGSILREGAQVVLVGHPNVGKSSLLNRLSGEEIALVSEVAGTTRDSIRQTINIMGVPLHIIDTAGLRETVDVVETMGIERTKLAINKADIVIVLNDESVESTDNLSSILKLIPENIPLLHVVNKIDLLGQIARIEKHNNEIYVYVSAKTSDGIDLLKEKILELVNWRGEEGVFMARERHLQALMLAKQHLCSATSEINRGEIFAEELRLAQEALCKITGAYSSDDLLGEIFSNFCIGK